MSNAVLGYGTVFQTGDGNSPEVFTTFAEVQTIGGPKIVTDSIDTAHEMPPGSVREYFPGMQDFGDVQITFNLDPNGPATAALMAEVATRPIRNRRIVYPDGFTWRFAAFLTGFETSQATADRLNGAATFKITGAGTLT